MLTARLNSPRASVTGFLTSSTIDLIIASRLSRKILATFERAADLAIGSLAQDA
jgi:hypothetical protein